MARLPGDVLLAQQIELSVAAGELPQPVTELRFHPTRRWRFDWGWPETMVALEYEGGTRSNGRHVRPAGYTGDCIKYSEAALAGWVVIRATWEMVVDGTALELVTRAIKSRAVDPELETWPEMGMDGGRCDYCGAVLQIVRPGKYQCPTCG